jgi:hypothetical protein
VTGPKVKGKVQLDELSVDKAVDVVQRNNKIIKNDKEE